jgi:putative flippase GtrA
MSGRLAQLVAYGGSGAGAAVAHYGVLIALVELFAVHPVPATLTGFVAGGVVSYALNRRFTFAATRSHAQAGWRFAVIAALGFLVTFGLMHLFVTRLALPYLPMQVLTTLIVMAVTFTGHKLWSFRDRGAADNSLTDGR